MRQPDSLSAEPLGWGGASVRTGGTPGVDLILPSVLTACLLRISTLVPRVVALWRSRLGLLYDMMSMGDCRVQDAQGFCVGSNRHGPEVREVLPCLYLSLQVVWGWQVCVTVPWGDLARS